MEQVDFREGVKTDHVGHHEGDASVIWLGGQEESHGVSVVTYNDGRDQEVKLVSYDLQDAERPDLAFDLDRAVDAQRLLMAQVEEAA